MDSDRIFKNLMLASEKAINNVSRDFDFCFYNEEMEAQSIREHAIERELSDLVINGNKGKLTMQFQPILDLRTNKIYGFEALARFNSDSYGRVSPLEFIPLAEKTKLIIPLGHQIITPVVSIYKHIERERTLCNKNINQHFGHPAASQRFHQELVGNYG